MTALSETAAGTYGWRIVWDLSTISSSNADAADAAARAAGQKIGADVPGAQIVTEFGGILADYERRLSIARAPLLLLLSEMAGLALIFYAAGFVSTL